MKILIQYFSVGIAGFFGSILRLLVATTCGRIFGGSFPVGTLLINLSGSFFLGWFMTVIGNRIVVSDTTRLAIAVGFVGAYTTFSTFMYESNSLLKEAAILKAAMNLFGSLVLGLLAVRGGIWFASR